MVQNKQKSNKINITALITCFMLIMVFVFGCVQFAYAETTDDFVYGEEASKYISSSGKVLIVVKSKNEYFTCFYRTTFITPVNRRIALLRRNNGDCYSFDVYLENNSVVESGMVSSVLSRQETGSSDIITSFSSSYGPVDDVYLFNGQNIDSFDKATGELVSVGCPVFDNKEDLNIYLNTGEVNNPIYQPKEDIEFDSDIEVPLNLDIRLNGNSDFVPNVKISCNQTEQVENRYLEVQYSIGYKATWRLLGGIGLNVKSKTSPTVYGSIEQLEDSFNNSDTSFETILSLSKLSHSVAPDEEAFSKYEPTPKVYWSLKEIKNDNSEMKIWCRNRVGNKASKWVMVSGDGYKANFDVVDSDENGNPTDMKDDTANSETGYGSDYWNNRDNTPQEDYSSTDVKNNLKDLKNNYTSLANFFKELFGFLPTEIWVILIGLIATMALIAIIMFVRG